LNRNKIPISQFVLGVNGKHISTRTPQECETIRINYMYVPTHSTLKLNPRSECVYFNILFYLSCP